MAMMPSRRMASGWFDISWVRSRILPLYDSIRSLKSAARSAESENAVADTEVSFPLSMRSSIPSWMTSV